MEIERNQKAFEKKLKKVEELKKKRIAKQTAKKHRHFMKEIPNSKEGWNFIKQMKKYLHSGRYSIRLKGRGSRKVHGNQSFVPIPHAEKYSVYIDHKILDRENPAYYHKKEWQTRSKLIDMKNQIDAILRSE